MKTVYQINLMPIEPMLFSDNRSSRAGEDHLINDQDPSPQTIYGAIGANIIAKLNSEVDRNNWNAVEPVLGKFEPDLAKSSQDRAQLIGYHFTDVEGRPWFPVPRHIVIRKINDAFEIGKQIELAELSGNEASSLPDSFSAMISVQGETDEWDGELYVGHALIGSILTGNTPVSHLLDEDKEYRLTKQFYEPEIRLGIGMDNDLNTTKKGLLFSRHYRRFSDGVDTASGTWKSCSFTAYYQTLTAMTDTQLQKRPLAFLGGDRGRALISFSTHQSLKPLEKLKIAVKGAVENSKGFFAYLLTPAIHEQSWPGPAGMPLVAAAIGKSSSISGWKIDKGQQAPRPIRQLIPAGSTFFFHWADRNGNARGKLVDSLWLQPISENYLNTGYGRMLIGVWK